jgi:hypothetical protein
MGRMMKVRWNASKRLEFWSLDYEDQLLY